MIFSRLLKYEERIHLSDKYQYTANDSCIHPTIGTVSNKFSSKKKLKKMDDQITIDIIFIIYVLLWFYGRYWRRKVAKYANEAAHFAPYYYQRCHLSRIAVMAGNSEACNIYQFENIDNFEDQQPLRPFYIGDVRAIFYGYYFPSRFAEEINQGQLEFCHTLFQFKDGETTGVDFFKTCLQQLCIDGNYLIMFMPCSNYFKYYRRFNSLNWYINKHCPKLTSGFTKIDIYEERESLHNMKGAKNRVLERNYRIKENLGGRNIIIIDDVLTTGKSVLDYKSELEAHGGHVVAAMFYGKTVRKPKVYRVRWRVWSNFLLHRR